MSDRPTLDALFTAQIAMVRAGHGIVAMEVEDRCYFRALWEADPDVRRPRPGARARALLLEDFRAWNEPPEPTAVGAHEIWLTLEQEREFRIGAPGGSFIVRRAPR